MKAPHDRNRAVAGALALAALVLAIGTGIVLAFFFDPRAPGDSLGVVELARPAGRIVRAVHGSSSHLALLFTLVWVLARGGGRAVALGLVLVAVAASGVLLRGDAVANLGRLAGYRLLGAIGAAILGPPDDFRLLTVHHAVTLAVPALLLAGRRGRRLWPGAAALGVVAAAALGLGWLAPPRLEVGLEPVAAGRWALYGLATAGLVAGALLARLPHPWRLVAGGALAALALGWVVLAQAGVPRLASQVGRPVLQPLTLAALPAAPVVRGRREGCPACHLAMGGLDPSHSRAALGCAACHLGDRSRPDAGGAHAGMLRVPGNLDSVALTCGQPGCHDAIAARVTRTMMTTGVGIVAVDRFVFGEQRLPDGQVDLDHLGNSPADRHLQQLCMPCHFSTIKPAPAPITEASRGGGCVACHLAETGPRPDHHPGHTVRVRDEACFGCHSRSGRISLAYAGWLEDEGSAEGERRVLGDRRILRRVEADAHHRRGMACIDCHTSQELMGDGRAHAHEEQATRVRCATCHRVTPARAVPIAAAGQEAAIIVKLRGEQRAELLVEDRSGEPLTNARPLADGMVEIVGKLDGARHLATRPARACTAIAGHERVSCQACHSAWVPRCIGCHTQLDPRTQEWVEYDVPPEKGLPTLGLLQRDGRTAIEPFVPGMVLTVNGQGAPAPPDPLPRSAASLIGAATRFVRAYAFAAPHTTTRAGRSCASCHLDPVALGYGRGRLLIEERSGAPAWRFEPAYQASRFDGLPGDAWIGFLRDPSGAVATRTEARPLGLAEQRRVLEPGACMTCHDPASAQGAGIFADYPVSRARRPAVCRVPP